jgi:hypothetical protein
MMPKSKFLAGARRLPADARRKASFMEDKSIGQRLDHEGALLAQGVLYRLMCERNKRRARQEIQGTSRDGGKACPLAPEEVPG